VDDVVFHVMGPVARSVGNIDVGAMLQQLVSVFARGRTLFDFFVVHSGTKLRIGDEVGYLRLPCLFVNETNLG